MAILFDVAVLAFLAGGTLLLIGYLARPRLGDQVAPARVVGRQ
jgi:hypothetical protein